MTEGNHKGTDPQSEEKSEASAGKDIQGADTQPDTAAEAQTPEAENSEINASHASANQPDTRPDHRPDHRMDEQDEAAAEMQAVEDFDLNLLLDIPLEITVELGRARIQIQELLNLGAGSTVTLSKLEGEPVDILANDQLIARGEVVLQNKKYGIRITEITSRMDRIKSLN
jgi:flagellar motor switch protein FliN/FliY